MDKSRQQIIKDTKLSGDSVIYVMSRDQRVDDNHALLAAQEYALNNNIPLYVLFVIRKVGVRSGEQYRFMVDGLKEVDQSLQKLGIPLFIKLGNPVDEITGVSDDLRASAIFFDFSPLLGARNIVKKVASHFGGEVIVVDTHNIIPCWVASDKQEFAAHTMRLKVHKKLADYLVSPSPMKVQNIKTINLESVSVEGLEEFISSLPKSGAIYGYPPGAKAANQRLKLLIENGLEDYAVGRNDISVDQQSGLSPYLHFGQISSLRVALDVRDAVGQAPLLLRQAKLAKPGEKPDKQDGMNALFEEMIVRKELSDNFCLYSKNYRSLGAAPEWAQATLKEHASDEREFVYSKEQWEKAVTHDKAWNAAQMELVKTGKMHGYMRMYWAKKILEWSATAQSALDTAIYLNDKYSIDGNDPNGYVGILWSIGGLHDRPWSERPVFGKIRYMNQAGLQRKFDLNTYIDRASYPNN